MQRVYGEFIINNTTSDNVVEAIKEYETTLNLNKVPEHFVLRKLGIKVDAACTIKINGRSFTLGEKETLEFGYDSIKVDSIIFETAGVHAIVRYMYFRDDKTYQ